MKPCVPASLWILQPSIHRSLPQTLPADFISTSVPFLVGVGLAVHRDPVEPVFVVVWDLCIDAKSFPVIRDVLQVLVTIRARVGEVLKADVSLRLATSYQQRGRGDGCDGGEAFHGCHGEINGAGKPSCRTLNALRLFADDGSAQQAEETSVSRFLQCVSRLKATKERQQVRLSCQEICLHLTIGWNF